MLMQLFVVLTFNVVMELILIKLKVNLNTHTLYCCIQVSRENREINNTKFIKKYHIIEDVIVFTSPFNNNIFAKQNLALPKQNLVTFLSPIWYTLKIPKRKFVPA